MTSLMLDEARAAGRAVAGQLNANRDKLAQLGQALRNHQPRSVVTVARGSSDHASSYFGYLVMARLGKLVTSLPMSLITLYRSPIEAQDVLAVAVSQSGQSPDLIGPLHYLREGGATTVALVNDANSPLAEGAEWVLPLCAGEERSVAATKSFITSLTAGAELVAHWGADQALLDALATLPAQLEQAATQDWQKAIPVLQHADRIMVLGRGLSHAIAMEAALKFKETCAIQAEAFSSAEVKHGPMALVDEGYPMLIFATRGPAQESLLQTAREMRARGASVLLAAPADIAERDLTLVTAAIPELDPILAIQSFYPMVEALARARGFDPDKPRHLSKVTKTN
ncbi:glucosamine--fructose-6-phosphate aminotransferase (isomerizing) [Chitinivorax tropicus]|uniref:Glucosamine--fructose-6-phosphate aminotransferase (Isomerizing) n=1 Tax=Chitinivorax tropicus TaxID=714531 RepID=A0A840MMC3_9PROT|nr:SIS domain-containing protein [Chitinivorax tropicus]MBB5018625.1 glucosamine--fructose-6-phosphate aminotransferase (isomerizing) [Chitinivorax tropicus]